MTVASKLTIDSSDTHKSNNNVVIMRNIVKLFPGVIANDHVDLEIKKGEIHALLGENGAGKTTLMNILYGLYSPSNLDAHILIENEEAKINSPIDAMQRGVGMVHQHFMLVPVMTVAENIILGSEPVINGIRLNEKEIKRRVLKIANDYQMPIDPDALVGDLPVGLQQRVEILKILYRGANILILDEPTAVLTPQEVTGLFKTLHQLQKEGKTIIIITHKLKEPMALANRVTVLRRGKVIGTVNTKESSPEDLAEMMIGRKLKKLVKTASHKGEKILEIKNLIILDESGKQLLKGISLDVSAGEIVGIAGVVGNGQRELAEAIAGLRKSVSGDIMLLGNYITNEKPIDLYDAGLSYIPEDRKKTGSVGEFSIAENLILGLHHHKRWFMDGIHFRKRRFFKEFFSFFYNWTNVNKEAEKLRTDFDIRSPSIFTKISSLSGGNQQKVIVAREIFKKPSLIIASQVTRGLDVGVIEYVHQRLVQMRDDGKGILLISSDLDEVLLLSDRIAVMYEGEIVAFENPMTTNERRLGLLMAGHVDRVESQ